METKQTAERMLEFIEKSPTSFHAAANMKELLKSRGYEELLESRPWSLVRGGKYFVSRNESALIAFQIPGGSFGGFQIMASHDDSPCFRVKEDPEMEAGPYIRLNVEAYGGGIWSTWFDRPLGVAGRVLVEDGGRISHRLVDTGSSFLMIPSLAIHMNRKTNEGAALNVQKDLLPLYAPAGQKGGFLKTIAHLAQAEPEQIYGMDLCVYNGEPGRIWGPEGEFVSSGRLDDLECAYASLSGFLNSRPGESVAVHCVFDNEEVGSGTKQGAASTFLADTLKRICLAFGSSPEEYRQKLAGSFLLSADNAHAVHPNYPEKADPVHQPKMNGGIVLKYNASQRYSTDGVSAALFRSLCEMAEVPFQVFRNRSDIPGGSTLGNIANTQTPMYTADIGLPQLAMHSCYETAGTKDCAYLEKAAKVFYEASFREEGAGVYRFL